MSWTQTGAGRCQALLQTCYDKRAGEDLEQTLTHISHVNSGLIC